MRPENALAHRLPWERPTILAVNSLPDALGDCVNGATETVGANGGCFDGMVTYTVGTTPPPGGHLCTSGNTEIED